MLRDDMTLGELLGLAPEQRIPIMRELQQACAARGDYRPIQQPYVNTQQGDGSIGVPRMPAAFPGTVLSGDDGREDLA